MRQPSKTLKMLMAAVFISAFSLLPLAQSHAATATTPAPASSANQTKLANAIQNVKSASVYKYMAIDSQFMPMDTAKIIANPAGGYMAVYHNMNPGSNVIRLATSTDLKRWTFKANLVNGTQPTIAKTSDGGFLLAYEHNKTRGGAGYVRVVYYKSLADLYARKITRSATMPHTLTNCSEGTPNITSAELKPDINRSVIKLGFHYHNNCDTDREATGTLTNWTSWSASKATGLDKAIINAAKLNGKNIGGNIGDRDVMNYGGTNFTIFEAQYNKGNFGTWRPYLYNNTTGQTQLLNIKTHKGSQSFANPTMTAAKGPDGKQGVIVTFYVPGEGAAFGEAGTLIYFAPLN